MTNREAHYRSLERMYLEAPANGHYRPDIHIVEGRAEVTIAARPELMHAAAAVHGSVYFKLLDDSCFFAVNSLVEDVFVLTSSFNIYLTRPITQGLMHGSGWIVHRSGRLFLAEGEVRDDDGRLAARGSGTFVRSRIELDERVGYRAVDTS